MIDSTPDFKVEIFAKPGMSEAEIQAEIDFAFERVYFMQAWLEGRLETDSFLDYLDEKKIDVFDLPSAWEHQGLVI